MTLKTPDGCEELEGRATMMRGHNRQHFPPKMPGTNTRSHDVPSATIYRPARSAMTSAPRPRRWVLEFEPTRPLQIEPLMGWTASDDPYRVIRLLFPDRDSAVEFAERQDWRYFVREDPPMHRHHNPWRGHEAHRLYRGADVAHRIPTDDRSTLDRRLHRRVNAEDTRHFCSSREDAGLDPVLQADRESFPVSDPPAWTVVTAAGKRSER